MKVMVIGSGGREHAVIRALKKSPEIDELYALPGNGGIAADAQCAAISAMDLDSVCQFAEDHRIDMRSSRPTIRWPQALSTASKRSAFPVSARAVMPPSSKRAKCSPRNS